jgi:hypothetical protein
VCIYGGEWWKLAELQTEQAGATSAQEECSFKKDSGASSSFQKSVGLLLRQQEDNFFACTV